MLLMCLTYFPDVHVQSGNALISHGTMEEKSNMLGSIGCSDNIIVFFFQHPYWIVCVQVSFN